jgi:hypothetical protein
MTTNHDQRRLGYITGIREYASWLADHPDVEPPHDERILHPVHTNHAVTQFAAAHGLTELITFDIEGNASVDVVFDGGLRLHVYGYRDWAATADRIDADCARKYAQRQGLRLVPDDTGQEAERRAA